MASRASTPARSRPIRRRRRRAFPTASAPGPDDPGSTSTVDVGAHLRTLRTAQGMSLRTLAESSGLNVNTLSLIENHRTSPSVGTLQQIARALSVPITAFFDDAAARQEIVLVRHNQGPRAEFAHGIMEDLGGGLAGHGAEPFVITLHPNTDSGDAPITHAGREFVYCLEGRLVYWVSQREVRLFPGDSLLFEGRLPHRWANADPAPSRALLVICPDAEHPRASDHHFGAT